MHRSCVAGLAFITAALSVFAQADLQITVLDPLAAISALHAPNSIQIEIHNAGPDDAFNVGGQVEVLADFTVTSAHLDIPIMLLFVDGQTVYLGDGSLANGSSVVLTIDGFVSAEGFGQITAQFGGDPPDPVHDNSDIVKDIVTLLAPDFVVNTTDEADDGNCDAAHCSLREAIQAANAAPGANSIGFDLPVTGAFESLPLTLSLPATEGDLRIDGWHQAQFDGDPKVVIDGSGVASLSDGFWGYSGELHLRGLVVNGFRANGAYFAEDGRVEGCYVGTDVTGATAVPNGYIGLKGDGVLTVGGTHRFQFCLVSGNGGRGIECSTVAGLPPSDSYLEVRNCYVGVDKSGSSALPNIGDGIYGGNLGGALLDGNVVSGNGGSLAVGIEFAGQHRTPLQVFNNYVGTDATGSYAIPNAREGISLLSVRHPGDPPPTQPGESMQIGAPGQGNLISGNATAGMLIATPWVAVEGNFVGTDASGLAAIPNVQDGISVRGSDNRIGGPSAGQRNVIAGNLYSGVNLGASGSPSRILVQGNYIGVGVDGATPLGNGDPNNPGFLPVRYGVDLIDVSDSVIGGPNPGEGNLIAANYEGVRIRRGSGNVIQGNSIGTDASGTMLLQHRRNGVMLDNTNQAQVLDNRICGSKNYAISLQRGADFDILGNEIGIGSDGSLLGNGDPTITYQPAIYLDALDDFVPIENVRIGGLAAGEGNRIAASNGPAIWVRAQYGPIARYIDILGNEIFENLHEGVLLDFGLVDFVTVRRNSIYANGHLGIQLNRNYTIPTVNDPLDADSGVNQFQNYPELASANVSGGTLTVVGNLPTSPSGQFVVDYYANQACDASGHGEGRVWLGSETVMTDGAGNAPLSWSVAHSDLSLDWIVATATDAFGRTSEFSACVDVFWDDLVDAPPPVSFRLRGNLPNPFNPATEIHFDLPRRLPVEILIFDSAGRRLRRLGGFELMAGAQRLVWDGRDQAGRAVASGAYLYRVNAGEFAAEGKMLLLK